MIINYMDSKCVGGQTFSRQKMVQDIYSSRTYVWIRRIVLVAHGTASDICWNMAMMMLPIEWYVCAQDHLFQYLPS
jgi:hypothetical protein